MLFRYLDQKTKTFLLRTVAAQLHLLGCLAALAGLVVLLNHVQQKADFDNFLACAIFGLTSILVFGASTIYHFMSDGLVISKKLEKRLDDLDHFAIYLFIAGTYTPFILYAISPPWNRALLGLVWLVALGGIVYTHFRPKLPAWARHRFVNTAIFVLMGWLLVVRIGEALTHLSPQQTILLFAGAASYTLGAVVYALKRPNPIPEIFGFHEIWHLMVLLGFGVHYFMILDFYL